MYMYFSPSMMLQLLQRIEIGHYKTATIHYIAVALMTVEK